MQLDADKMIEKGLGLGYMAVHPEKNTAPPFTCLGLQTNLCLFNMEATFTFNPKANMYWPVYVGPCAPLKPSPS